MAIDSVSNKTIEQVLAQSAKSTENRRPGEMGKDQFLNLLITQLKYQDPMNPVQDKEFIGQMAQFSSLEQMQNLNTAFNTMRGSALLGQVVKASIMDPLTKAATDITGTVSNVKLTKEGVMAIVNGKEVAVEKITNISQEGLGSAQDVSRFTGYIGFKVKGSYLDNDGNALGVTGIVKEVRRGDTEEMAVLDGTSVLAYSVDAPTKLSTLAEKQAFLDKQMGKALTVSTLDQNSKKMMEVTGTLADYSISESGMMRVVFNDMVVPVKGISSVMDARY